MRFLTRLIFGMALAAAAPAASLLVMLNGSSFQGSAISVEGVQFPAVSSK